MCINNCENEDEVVKIKSSWSRHYDEYGFTRHCRRWSTIACVVVRLLPLLTIFKQFFQDLSPLLACAADLANRIEK